MCPVCVCGCGGGGGGGGGPPGPSPGSATVPSGEYFGMELSVSILTRIFPSLSRFKPNSLDSSRSMGQTFFPQGVKIQPPYCSVTTISPLQLIAMPQGVSTSAIVCIGAPRFITDDATTWKLKGTPPDVLPL